MGVFSGQIELLGCNFGFKAQQWHYLAFLLIFSSIIYEKSKSLHASLKEFAYLIPLWKALISGCLVTGHGTESNKTKTKIK